MEKLYQLTDQEFETQFEDCSFNPTMFSHQAHLRLAWVHIRAYGIDRAIENVCMQIKRFDAIHGDGNKFHATLTVASVRAVYHFILKSSANNFQDYIAEFPRIQHNFMGLIKTHYGFNLFSSEDAKQAYLEPDLLPFD